MTADLVAVLQRENAKLRKINEVLMRRVERSMDMQGGDYALFETAILLETKVRDRTAALERALQSLQGSNRALVEAKAEAERANLGKTRFLAAVSHDLLQPLSAARLFLAALGETEQTEKSRRLIENTELAFGSVEQLLGSLLEISKLDAGVLRADIRDVPLAAVIGPLVKEFEPIAERKGLELRAVRSSAVGRTDPDLLARIVRNLLSNAVRYTPSGRILVGVRRRGPARIVEVGDTGVGIPSERQDEIFEEFKRLGADADCGDRGFGLGLSIVRRTTKLLGHKVEVRSEPGRGARFLIQIPAGTSRGVSPDPSAPLPAALGAAAPLVLVIDNEEAIQAGMRAMLRHWGYNVICGASAGAVAARLKQQRHAPDLVIADYHLEQRRNGTEAIFQLRREFGSSLPGVIITADRTPRVRQHIAAAGLMMMHKPVQPAQLRSVLRHLIPERAA